MDRVNPGPELLTKGVAAFAFDVDMGGIYAGVSYPLPESRSSSEGEYRCYQFGPFETGARNWFFLFIHGCE